MAGSAVVTINRSRLNMNSAAEVSANVQPVLARALRALRSGGRGAEAPRPPTPGHTRTSLGRAPGSNPGDEWAQLTCRGRRELPAAADIELPVCRHLGPRQRDARSGRNSLAPRPRPWSAVCIGSARASVWESTRESRLRNARRAAAPSQARTTALSERAERILEVSGAGESGRQR